MDRDTYEWLRNYLRDEPHAAKIVEREADTHRALVQMAQDKKIGVPTNGVSAWANYNQRK